MRSLNGFLLVK